MTGKFSRTIDKKTDFTLNNIITTLSVSFFGKKIRGQMLSKCPLLFLTLLVFHCSIDTTAINRKWYMLIVHCFIEATAISLKHKYLAPLWLLPMNINDHKTSQVIRIEKSLNFNGLLFVHCLIEATAISLKHKYLAPLWLFTYEH